MKLTIASPKLIESLRKFSHYFVAHNRLIFFIMTISVLIYAVLSLNLMLSQPSDGAYRDAQSNSSRLTTQFDKATIDLINSLNSGQKTNSESFPSGRVSPFSE